MIMKTAINMQKILMTSSLAKEWDSQALVGSLKRELQASLGASFDATVSHQIDGALEVMTATLEDNISCIRSMLEEISHKMDDKEKRDINELKKQLKT